MFRKIDASKNFTLLKGFCEYFKFIFRTVYKCKEVMDNQVTVIKNALSACLIDQDRLVVGTEEGLYSVDLERDGEFFITHSFFISFH